MSTQNRIRALGVYLLLCTAYQTAIYFRPNLFPDPTRIDPSYFSETWFHFANPRIGLFALIANSHWDHPTYFISAIWLFIIACAIVALPKPTSLKVYAVSELCMSVPAVFYLVAGYFLRSWPSNPFATDYKLQTQIAVFVFFSVVPCVAAIFLLRDSRLILKLIATFGLSLLALPVGVLLAKLFGGFVDLALIFPLIVFIVGIGWTFKGANRIVGSSNVQDSLR